MKQVGIITNYTKDESCAVTLKLITMLELRGFEVLVPHDTFNKVGIGIPTDSYDIFSKPHLIISLGGDGTLLQVARQAAEHKIPVLGINMGRLGFLTEIEVSEIEAALDILADKSYTIEKRMMLEVRLKKVDGAIFKFVALNDVAVTKASYSRIVHLKAYINDELVNFFPADGLLVSSPTGSTAYSLSAGGPIISPEMECLLLTPICPHSLNVRPIVTDAKNILIIEVVDVDKELMLTVDGQEGAPLSKGDIVVISKSVLCTDLIRLKQRNFFRLLRAKLTERHVENEDF